MAKISPSTFTSLLGTFAKVGLNAVLCFKGMPADSSMLISELAGGMFTSFDFDLNDNPLKKFYKLVLKSLRASLEESGLNLRNDQLTAMADSMFSINEMQYFQAQNPDSIDRLRDGFRNCLQYQTAFSDAEMANYDLDAILASLLEKIQQGITQDQGLTSLAAYRTVTNVADDVKEIKRMLAALDQDKDSFPKVLTPIAPFLPDSFIHRDQELADVLAWFSSGKHVLVISGMGGLGKSSLARAVCGRLEKEIDHLAWLTYSGDLEVDLLNLRLWEANPDRNSRFIQIRNFLSSTDKQVLIVLDNVNEKPSSDYLSTLAAFSPTTRVLLTSRLPTLRGFEVYPLGFLSTDQCEDLFYQYYSGDRGRQHSAIVRQIAASVGRHTLTVELIARSAEVEAEALPALWDRLQKAGFTYSEAMLELNWRPEEHTLQQHLKALFSLADLDQEKQRVMRVFSILPPSAPIPAQIKEWLPCQVADLQVLVERGWLQRNGLTYSVHQMVQQSVRLQQKPDLKDCQGLIEAFGSPNFIPRDTAYGEASTRLSLAKALLDWFDPAPLDEDFARCLSYTAGSYEQNLGDYPRALDLYQKALTVSEKALGPDHPSTATSYNNLAGVYASMGDYPRALDLYQKALAVREKALGPDHPSTASSYNNLGYVYRSLGEYPRALDLYQKALAVWEKALGPDHPSTATSYNNLAGVYASMGDYPRALDLYQKALAVREKALGPDHPSTATSYNNLAGVYDSMGDYPRALDLYQKALAVLEKALGPDHPSTATSYNNLAGVYYRMGDYPRALDLYQKALTVSEKALGPDHPSTAASYNNLAGVYDSMGDYPRALELYQKALTVREKALGPDHPDTASSYNNLGYVYDSMGEYPRALELYQKALAVREKALGPDHPDTATSYNNLGYVYRSMGDYPRALDLYQKALTVREKALGPDHPSTATSYNNLAGVYASMGDYPRALELYQKALTVREKALGPDHPDTASSYNNLGYVYDSMGEYPRALELYQKALAVREKALGPDHPDTATSYNNLAGVYYRMGDYKSALDLFLHSYLVLLKRLGRLHPTTLKIKANLEVVFNIVKPSDQPFEKWLEEQAR